MSTPTPIDISLGRKRPSNDNQPVVVLPIELLPPSWPRWEIECGNSFLNKWVRV